MNGKVSEEVRTQYADEIAAISGILSQAPRNAFARVPRERFLGPAPWRVVEPWIFPRELRCGSGYYSAVIAEVVGPKGSVTAVEVDPQLASVARENLAADCNVNLVEGDGGTLCPGLRNAILVNAGVTHPAAIWLDNLKIGGTLLVPNVGKGFTLRIERELPSAYTARFLPSPVMVYSCTSVRDASAMQLLGKALMTGTMTSVQSLRRDPHAPGPDCWLHTDSFCLAKYP